MLCFPNLHHTAHFTSPSSPYPFTHQLSPKPGAGIRAKSCAEVIFLFKHYCIQSSQSSSVSTVRTNRAINYNIRIHYVNKGSLDIVTSSVHRSKQYFLHPILKPLIKSNQPPKGISRVWSSELTDARQPINHIWYIVPSIRTSKPNCTELLIFQSSGDTAFYPIYVVFTRQVIT